MGVVSLMLVACVTVPEKNLLLISAPVNQEGSAPRCFDDGVLRVLSWNIHKATHRGLTSDLKHYAAENDLLLLQEAVLDATVREVLVHEGYGWQMTRAFAVGGRDRGVIIAARIAPVDGRALCTYEPLFPIPKSAIIAHYRLAGRRESLAVANLHGINFSLGLGRFREQIDAIASELRHHQGPIIFGGDFNTWSSKRYAVLFAVAKQLGLEEVKLSPDERRSAFGQHLDHFFIRGFKVVNAGSPEVKSSDHNPILVKVVRG
ncbi:MAG: hypothetical protein RL693_1229 [Verrucomicrobiota bacterium]|jgi:endonuclease/exonuclease/phosphatase (EEP) superfamily protein YafD